LGVPEEFIYICIEVFELTLYTISTMLFKTALHSIERFSIKKIEASKIRKTVGRVTKPTDAQLTTDLTFS